MDHVYHNINFSRIAVRNNHAITETSMLFICGTLFPFLPNASKWKIQGKRWFEKEIIYQIYEDGTFLQFSHNYNRVVIQLLTIALIFAEINKYSDEEFLVRVSFVEIYNEEIRDLLNKNLKSKLFF